ncbi:MAG: tetratricopeptide repeat protein [Yoonia sp.]
MSDTDSFINEVSEEVRRDALYGYLRKYGWIAVVVVLGLVGGAAYNEYSKSQARATSQAAGDALLDALNSDNDSAARAAALATVEVEGSAVAVSALLTAASHQEAGDTAAAAAALGALATNMDVPEIYRELGALKAAMLPSDDADARMAALDALAQPGAPFYLLALEQIALMQVAAGETDTALATLERIAEDAGVTRGLRERAQTLIVALGGEITIPAAE